VIITGEATEGEIEGVSKKRAGVMIVVATGVEIVEDSEEGTVLWKCTRQHVQNVTKHVKFLSDQTATSQCTVVIVLMERKKVETEHLDETLMTVHSEMNSHEIMTEILNLHSSQVSMMV